MSFIDLGKGHYYPSKIEFFMNMYLKISIKLYLQKVLALYFSYNLFYSKVSFIINFLRRMDGSLHATIYNNYIHVNNY